MTTQLRGPVSGRQLDAQDRKRKQLRSEASGALRAKAAGSMGLAGSIEGQKADFQRTHAEATRAGSRDIHTMAARGLGQAMGSAANTGIGANYAAARASSAAAGQQAAGYRAERANELAAKNMQYDQQMAAAQRQGYDDQAAAAKFDVESMDRPQQQVAEHRNSIQKIFEKHSGFFDDDENAAASEIENLAAQETDAATRAWLMDVAARVRSKDIDFGDTMSWLPGRSGQPTDF